MYKCEYCKRYLKKKYKECPSCGSSKFKKVQNVGEVIIKQPPKDGYNVNLKNIEHGRKGLLPFIIIVFLFVVSAIYIGLPIISLFSSSNNDKYLTFKIVFALIMIFIFIGLLIMVYKTFSKKSRNGLNDEVERIKKLAKNGMLIKNLKYEIKPLKNSIDKSIYKIRIIYEIEKGKTMCFESEPKYSTALGRSDGTVDLLIDPNDYTNYFIDFEIY